MIEERIDVVLEDLSSGQSSVSLPNNKNGGKKLPCSFNKPKEKKMRIKSYKELETLVEVPGCHQPWLLEHIIHSENEVYVFTNIEEIIAEDELNDEERELCLEALNETGGKWAIYARPALVPLNRKLLPGVRAKFARWNHDIRGSWSH